MSVGMCTYTQIYIVVKTHQLTFTVTYFLLLLKCQVTATAALLCCIESKCYEILFQEHLLQLHRELSMKTYI